MLDYWKHINVSSVTCKQVRLIWISFSIIIMYIILQISLGENSFNAKAVPDIIQLKSC